MARLIIALDGVVDAHREIIFDRNDDEVAVIGLLYGEFAALRDFYVQDRAQPVDFAIELGEEIAHSWPDCAKSRPIFLRSARVHRFAPPHRRRSVGERS